MTNEPDADSRMDQYMDRVLGIINTHGWVVQGVFPTADDPGLDFIYTVGLSQWNHPELIVFSLGHQTGGMLLNDLGERVRASRRVHPQLGLDAGQVLDDLVAGLTCTLVEVDDTTEHFGVARRLYPVVRGLQLVWPDKDNRLPWQPGYSIRPELQPVLGTPS